MSGSHGDSPGQTINDMATTVVRIDAAAQSSIDQRKKGDATPATGVMFVPDWSQKGPTAKAGWANWQKAAVVLIGIFTLGAGTVVGYNLFAGQPGATQQPTLVAAPPTQATQTSQPTADSQPTQPQPTQPQPTQPQPTEPPLTPAPTEPPTPTPEPVITPVPIAIADGLDEILTGDPIGFADDGDDQDEESDADPDVPAQPQTDLAGAYVAPATVAGQAQALAMLDSFVAGTVRAAQVEENWPCADENVFCGQTTELADGEYFVIGFSTAAPPPTSSDEGIYQVFYLMTDLDGDWLNNAFVTPPLTNYIYLSSQYVIEGGWYGTVDSLGETDYRGPIGPDGQTPQYNQTPASRLVLNDDPMGGFFLVPEDRIGSWFRVATMWRDFNTAERRIRVDAVGALGGLEMMPVTGRATLPETLTCVRVDIAAEPLDEQPSQLQITFGSSADSGIDARALATVSILQTTQDGPSTVDHPDLALEDVGGGVFRIAFGVPAQTQQGFASFVVTPTGGEAIDLTEELIVLGGAGVNVPSDFSGYALGQADCGA
jgi:hypothetical protein